MSIAEPSRVEFMYRRPGMKEHENITHVLDDIIIKLQAIEVRLEKLENN